jgi:hypothetical protein
VALERSNEHASHQKDEQDYGRIDRCLGWSGEEGKHGRIIPGRGQVEQGFREVRKSLLE